MRVILTGATGVIGGTIEDHLLSLEVEIVELRDVFGNRADLRIMDPLKQAVEGIDFIVHCASPIPFKDKAVPDTELAGDITRIDLNVMKLASRLHARVFYLSTCGLYDRTCQDFQTEDHTPNPQTPYAAAKYSGEKLFLNHTDSVCLRISSPFGKKIHRSAVIARFLECVEKKSNITLWGSGNREQDFICTTDIARFIAQQLLKWNSGIFNVVSENPVTMYEIATLISANTNSKIEFSGKVDPEECLYSRYSASKSKNTLEWEARESIQMWIKNLKHKEVLW
jgi:nucleoside-diphosphate-sugar epimerase